MNAQQIVDEIFELYKKHGSDDYIGEPVSQIEHMSQSAQLAMNEMFDDEVVLAAFFHDIGHLCAKESENMGGYGVKSHEKIGADFLRSKGFSGKIASLVENHVQAKRYLTFAFPEYYERLSEASKKTLEYQGGKMTKQEAEAFEIDPLFVESIRMRHWDEEAKIENVPLMDLDLLKSKALRVLNQKKPTSNTVTYLK